MSKKVTIELIILLGMVGFFILILIGIDIENLKLFCDLLKILIGGYLGYLVKDTKQ